MRAERPAFQGRPAARTGPHVSPFRIVKRKITRRLRGANAAGELLCAALEGQGLPIQLRRRGQDLAGPLLGLFVQGAHTFDGGEHLLRSSSLSRRIFLYALRRERLLID